MRVDAERLRRALWTFKQPLARVPSRTGMPVSDLFVWRNSDEWKTFFELTDISSLFSDNGSGQERFATFMFFDGGGNTLLEKRVALATSRRQTIDISALLSASAGLYGTFCVFHEHTPKTITDLGSFIAERGYVSYRYRGASLRGYVHGNLDAVALRPGNSMQMLGSRSVFAREFRLQHELLSSTLYELALVNPCARKMSLFLQVFSVRGKGVLEQQRAAVQSKGCHVFPIRIDQSQTARVVIRSRFVMARPLVFRIQNQTMDVFHG